MDLNFDKILHQPHRAEIMRLLVHEGTVSFQVLKEEFEFTDGNLSTHLHTLEKAKYVSLEKIYENNRPKTIVKITPKGKESFETYVEEIKKFIQKYEIVN